ncbi:hypothetical protein DMENIID0001_142640 [Sergentomyia squamirostris]
MVISQLIWYGKYSCSSTDDVVDLDRSKRPVANAGWVDFSVDTTTLPSEIHKFAQRLLQKITLKKKIIKKKHAFYLSSSSIDLFT